MVATSGSFLKPSSTSQQADVTTPPTTPPAVDTALQLRPETVCLDDIAREASYTAFWMRQVAFSAGYHIQKIVEENDLPREVGNRLLSIRSGVFLAMDRAHRLNGVVARAKYGPDWESDIAPDCRWVYGLPDPERSAARSRAEAARSRDRTRAKFAQSPSTEPTA